MFLLKIERDSIIIIDGQPYRFLEGGTDADGTFFGAFVNGIDQVTISTPEKTAISLTDTIKTLIDLLTRRPE